MAAALHGVVVGHPEYALHLLARVVIGVVSLVVVLIFLAEVHAARELAYAHEVCPAHYLVFQGRLVDEPCESLHGPYVGKEPQPLAHGEQPLLRAYTCGRVVVELGVAHGGEEHRVGVHARGEGLFGEGVAHPVYGGGSAERGGEADVVGKPLCHGLDHCHSLLHNLRPYAVARQYCYVEFHIACDFSCPCSVAFCWPRRQPPCRGLPRGSLYRRARSSGRTSCSR